MSDGRADTQHEVGTPSVPPHRDAAELVKSAEREKWRAALRASNAEVWLHGPNERDAATLDTTLKRNSAFLKRFKQANLADAKDALVKEMHVLSLTKYLDELIPSVPEVLWKATQLKDRYAAVEVLSALHARFGGATFTEPLMAAVAHELQPPPPKCTDTANEQAMKEEAAKVARQRNLLRGATELVLVGLVGPIPDADHACTPGLAWLHDQMREMLAQDRDLVYMSVAQAILRAYGATLVLPVAEHEAGQPADRVGEAPPGTIVSEEQSAKFRKLFEAYFAAVAKRVKREAERLREQEQRNNDAYVRSGLVFDDRQAAFERRAREVQTMMETMHGIASALQVTVPAMPVGDAKHDAQRRGVNLEATSTLAEMTAKMEQEYASGKSPWEDDEMRKFYKDVCDLRERLPLAVLECEPRADEPLPAVLDSLPTLCNRTMVDDMAVTLGQCLRALSVKRLVGPLVGAPKHRWDLPPYYARLIATLQPFRPGLAEAVVDHVDHKLRQQQAFKRPDRQLQSFFTIYLGELTKFGLVAEHVIFHTLKVLLDDFSPTSIDMLALLIETCGRFLHRMPATGVRMQGMLDLLRRKRIACHLSEHHALLLDNAYYKCVPPERPVVLAREPTRMEQFITHVFTHLLTHAAFERVYALIKMLDWRDESVHAHLFQHFTSPWLVQHGAVPVLARLLARVKQVHAPFVGEVLDAVCEDVEADLVHLEYAGHQRRIARMHYLGECHAQFLVSPDAMLMQLYRLCAPRYRRRDPRTDFTRVRMACTLLAYFGPLFRRPPHKKPFERVCALFQYYTLTKAELPVDVAHLVHDTLARLGITSIDRERVVQRVQAAPFSKMDLLAFVAHRLTESRHEDESDESESDAGDADASASEASVVSGASVSDAGDASDASASERASERADSVQGESESESDEDARELAREAALDARAETELEQELAMLLSDAGPANASGVALEQTRTVLAEAQVPRTKARAPAATHGDHMVFSLVSRRAMHEIHVPASAPISRHAQQQQAEAAAERQQLKGYVLAYRERED